MIPLNLDDLKTLRERARAAGTTERWGDLMLEWAESATRVIDKGQLAATVLAEADRLLYDWTPAFPDRIEARAYVMTRIDKALEGAPRHPSALPGEGSWDKE